MSSDFSLAQRNNASQNTGFAFSSFPTVCGAAPPLPDNRDVGDPPRCLSEATASLSPVVTLSMSKGLCRTVRSFALTDSGGGVACRPRGASVKYLCVTAPQCRSHPPTNASTHWAKARAYPPSSTAKQGSAGAVDVGWVRSATRRPIS